MRFFQCLTLAAAMLAAPLSAAVAAPLALTKADGQSQDAPGEVSADAAGFVMGWVRTKLSPAFELSVRARQFSSTGAAVGKELVFDKQPSMLADPVVLPVSGSKVAAFWLKPATGLVARLGDTATGVLGAEKTVLSSAADLIAEVNADVIRLTNGNFLALTYKYDKSASPLAKRVAVTLIGPDLKVLKKGSFVPGPKASYVATGASDFTAVPLSGGGALVAYRNRLDGAIYAVTVDAAGTPGTRAVKVNQKSSPLGVAGQQVEFEVEGARLANGNVAIVWTRIGSTVDDDAFDISYRILKPSGAAVSGELSATASLAESQLSPDIAVLPGAGFALSWTNNGLPAQGRPRSYVLRKFGASGTPAAAPKVVFTGPRSTNSQASELVAAGSKVVVIGAAGSSTTTLQGFLTAP
ncbi:hypothetical protein [Oryzibacter oryziterrae]|uniref:hypothetical protein n=1 Tax=Oryzibacter oryziterrae TaxID=2766474 RepID=UPI001F2F35BC|nr:hypothetical protein [Oryzibacter oryziterrae]